MLRTVLRTLCQYAMPNQNLKWCEHVVVQATEPKGDLSPMIAASFHKELREMRGLATDMGVVLHEVPPRAQ